MESATLLVVIADCPEGVSTEDFNTWYNDEHIPERLAIKGFEWAARYEALDPGPRYLAVYGLSCPEVLSQDAYRKLGDESKWSPATRRVFPPLRAILRRYVVRHREGSFPNSKDVLVTITEPGRAAQVHPPGAPGAMGWAWYESDSDGLLVQGVDEARSQVPQPAGGPTGVRESRRFRRVRFFGQKDWRGPARCGKVKAARG